MPAGAEDGEWVFLAAPQDGEWAALCRVLDALRPESSRLAEDPRFATSTDRWSNDAELADVLASLLGLLPATEWEQRLTAADVACVEVSRTSLAAFTVSDPVMIANGHVAEAHYPGFGAFRRHGPTVSLPANPTTVGSAPQVGQHTRPVLGELGYSQSEIARLRADAIVTWPDDPST